MYALDITTFMRGEPSALLSAGAVWCWLWAGFFLVDGMHHFLDIRLPRAWKTVVVVLCGWGLLAGILKFHLAFLYLPSSLWTGWMYVRTGIRFLASYKTELTGKGFAGVTILLSGLHSANFPFLMPIEWFAPWGYLIAAVLKFTTANGTLLVYYQRVRANLDKSEATLRMIAENANDVIFCYLVRPRGSVEYVSPSVEKVTGYSVREFQEDPRLLMRQIHPEDRQVLQDLIRSSGDRTRVRFRWMHRQQTEVWVELQAKLVKDSNARVLAIEGIARDITQQKHQEDELRALHRSRKELFSDISHELRTPISTIQAYAEAILDGIVSDTSEVHAYVQTIHSRAVRINRLIKDLLNLARLENKQISFTLEPQSVPGLVTSIYEKNALDVQTAGLSFVLDLKLAAQDPDLFVDVDLGRIDQVFANIVDNAIKHTPIDEQIRFEADVVNNSKFLLIGVSDSGCGIDSEDLPNIFERFYRAKFTTTSYFGSGLGLAICKEIVERHGGSIWAESEKGNGSTFYISLPLLRKQSQAEH